MAATNVQVFSGDVEISSNVTAANSKFSLDTNGTLKQENLGGNGRYIKLMKYFGDVSNWKIATGSYSTNAYQWINMRVKMARLDSDVKTIQFNFLGTGGIYGVREPMIIGTSANNEVKVYVNTSTLTYEIYIQTNSASSVEVEISHRGSTIDDDYSTVAAGAVSETGLTKIYDSSTTTDFIVKSGRVGIGVANPGGLLDILAGASNPSVPTVHIGDNAGDYGNYGMVNLVRNSADVGTKAHLALIRGGNTIFSQGFYNNTNTFGFWSSFGSVTNTPTMAFTTNGNVGIGKTNPSILLDVGNALVNPRIGRDLLFGAVHDADKRDSIFFGRRDGTGADFLGMRCEVNTHTALGYGGYSNQTKIAFNTWGNNYAASREVMTILGSGNVGIGTVTPDVKFQVEGTSSSHQKLTKLATWTIYHHRSDGGFEHLVTYAGYDGQAYYDNRANFMYVQIPAFSGETLYTSTPDNYGSGYFNARLRDLNGGKPSLATNTVYKVHAYSSRIDPYGYMTTSGRVGIGTTNPGYKLHVEGSVFFNSPWTGSSSISKTQFTSATYFDCIPVNSNTGYRGYKVQIRFDPSPGAPPYGACAYVDWFPIGTNSVGPQYNVDIALLTTAHAPNGINHSMFVSGTMALGVGTSGLRLRTASNYYTGTFTSRWYQIGSNV